MPYLGAKPTPIPLTSSDITDGIVTTAKIADTAISTAKIADDAVTGAKIENSPSIANGLTLTDGNLTFASGHGIDFSASSNVSGMTTELFDDYEEGTWSPTLNAFSGTPTISNAEYVKSGKLVLVACRVLLDGTSDSSRFSVGSLPFTTANTTAGVFGGGVSYTNSSFSRNIYLIVSTNSTQFELYEESASNFTYTELGTSKEIRLYAIYKSQ